MARIVIKDLSLDKQYLTSEMKKIVGGALPALSSNLNSLEVEPVNFKPKTDLFGLEVEPVNFIPKTGL